MAWLASLPGRLLEAVGNGGPRGMVAHDRTRLIGGLPTPVGGGKSFLWTIPPAPFHGKGVTKSGRLRRLRRAEKSALAGRRFT